MSCAVAFLCTKNWKTSRTTWEEEEGWVRFRFQFYFFIRAFCVQSFDSLQFTLRSPDFLIQFRPRLAFGGWIRYLCDFFSVGKHNRLASSSWQPSVAQLIKVFVSRCNATVTAKHPRVYRFYKESEKRKKKVFQRAARDVDRTWRSLDFKRKKEISWCERKQKKKRETPAAPFSRERNASRTWPTHVSILFFRSPPSGAVVRSPTRKPNAHPPQRRKKTF